MNKEKEMNKGKGNRQQKKRTKNRKRNEEQKRRGKTRTRFGNQSKIREPKQNSGNKQNPRQDPKVAGDKYRNLKTFYSVCLTLNQELEEEVTVVNNMSLDVKLVHEVASHLHGLLAELLLLLTSSLRTPRNINHPFFLGNNA